MYGTGMYHILFPEEIQDPYLSLISVGLECRTSADYDYDNANRSTESILFQYTLQGKGIFETKQNLWELVSGSAFFISIPSETKYYYPKHSPNEPWVYIYIMIKGPQARKYYQLISQNTEPVFELPLENKVIQTVFSIFNQAKTGHLFSPYYVSELLYRFLCQLCQAQIYSDANHSKLITSALKIMENNYASLRSIEELTDILNISFGHFTREFTKETGTNPIQYLTNIRLTQSVKLLLETSMPIDSIATSCGFSNGNYFSKLFKKHMNISPGKYRKEWK